MGAEPTLKISLNGFLLELSARSFRFYKCPFPDNKQLRAQRQQHEDWFIYWRDGEISALPKEPNPRTTIGTEVTELCTDHLPLIAARITDLLPTLFPQYEAFRTRPFSFLSQRTEIVQETTKGWKNAPPILKEFSIRPCFELEAKIVEATKDDTY